MVNMGKFRCFKFECETCKVVATIQVYFNKANEMRYGRARHYQRMTDGKPVFSYCAQSKEYLEEKLRVLGQSNLNVNLETNQNVYQLNLKASSECELEPSAGFGPATITLPR
jgi:hypothetical protein